MRHPVAPPRRSRRERTVRLLLAVAVAAGGWVTVSRSLAQAVAVGSPALAHRLAPGDGRVTAAVAASLAGAEASAADRRRSDGLARLALRQDATAVLAASTLGVNADFRGDAARARRLFGYVRTLSRRDIGAHLWGIEDAVGRGDVAGALRSYDMALRVKPALSELLYPVLASASADPAIRAELIRTLAGKPSWTESFVSYAAAHGTDPDTTATLLLGLRRAGVAVPPGAHAGAINALVARGLFDRAWAYYAAVRPGAVRNRSRDPRFSAVATPSRFDWEPINEAATTSLSNGAFDFAAPASVGGPLLQQLQLLPPGRYRLSGHSQGIDQPARAAPYWTLRCDGGRELGRVDLPNSTEADGRFAATLDVPAGCPVQLLTLVARPTDAVAGVSGQIDRVQLVPAR